MKSFETAALAVFHDEMVEHLRQHDPILASAGGIEALRKIVEIGIGRAQSYGFTLRGPIRLYLETMLALGSGFDIDPQYYWLRGLLTNRGDRDEMEAAERFRFHLTKYLDDVHGPGGDIAIGALHKVAQITLGDLEIISSDFNERAVISLRNLHPTKCDFVGGDALKMLVRHSEAAAGMFPLAGPQGPPLLLGLMFAFGAGITSDPMYTWVPRSLTEPLSPGGRTAVERLLDRTKAYVRRMLAQLGAATVKPGEVRVEL